MSVREQPAATSSGTDSTYPTPESAEEWDDAVAAELPSSQPEPGAPVETPSAEGLADVRSVGGVSPVIGFLLAEAGMRTVADLARATPDEVRAALAVPGVLPVDDDTITAWIETARNVARGG